MKETWDLITLVEYWHLCSFSQLTALLHYPMSTPTLSHKTTGCVNIRTTAGWRQRRRRCSSSPRASAGRHPGQWGAGWVQGGNNPDELSGTTSISSAVSAVRPYHPKHRDRARRHVHIFPLNRDEQTRVTWGCFYTLQTRATRDTATLL